MSYPATVFSVMIASPGDVGAERAIVREVIAEWNAVHAKTRSIVLLPVGWETHSVPEMGAHPQEIINRQVLAQCDLLVGVFWTRIGTATPQHASGTVEEIEKHIADGKPTMLYFSSQPVAPDSVDPVQYARLKEFKESCQARGLYVTYDTVSEFRGTFYRQLQLNLNEHSIFTSVTAALDTNSTYQHGARLPNLSPEAKQILTSASRDDTGLIQKMTLGTSGGTGILLMTGRHELVSLPIPREAAPWYAAIDQLLSERLIEAMNTSGTVLKVTARGYEVADLTGG